MSVEEFLRARREYLRAKAAYEAVEGRVSEKLRRLRELAEAEAITVDDWAKETGEIEVSSGLELARLRLREAEDGLMEAAIRLMESLLAADGGDIRRRVVEALMKLEV